MSDENKTPREILNQWIECDAIDVNQYNREPYRPLETQVDFLRFRLTKALSVLTVLLERMITESEQAKAKNEQ